MEVGRRHQRARACVNLSYVNADLKNNAIYKSAEEACEGNSPGDEHFKPFNALATLTAAIEILEKIPE